MADRSAKIAKVTRPVLTGNYPRKRLFRLIDRARKQKLLWISGPAGSGKTTLVSSYLAARRIPCLWYRLEEGDEDPATFFHYLGLAANRATPRTRKPLPGLAPEQRSAIAIFAQRYFEGLFSHLSPGSVIVFDDYQKVPAGSVFHTMIRDGLSLLPPGIGVILISRGQPPSPFARLHASRSLEVIGWKELRLSYEETEGIARLRWKGKRKALPVKNLQTRTDGWAAGLVLLLEKTEPGPVEPKKLNRHNPQEIFDYFGGEILENLDEEIQAFLLKSANLPRMTARMAAKLTGQRRASQILSYLNRHNYFTEVHQHPEPVYVYHPLFRDFLLSHGGDLFSAKYLQRLKVTTSAVLEEAGYEEEAAEILRELGSWERLAQILLRQAPGLVRQGRSGTIEEWVDSLPEKTREGNPWLLYWSGFCRLPSRPGDSQRDFEKAFRLFKKRNDRDGMVLSWAGIVDAIIYGGGSLKSLDPWFSTLDGLLKKSRTPVPEEIESRVTGTMIKALSLRRPPFVDMEEWAGRAMRLARATQDITLKFSSLLNVAYYRFHSGDFPETGLLIDSLRGMLHRPELSPLPRLTLCWLEAAYANMHGLHDKTLKLVAEGFELADATGVHIMDYLLTGHGALSSLHKGDRGTAAGFLRKMASKLTSAQPWEASFYHRLVAWDALHRGDQAQALFHSERCLDICEEVGNPWTAALALLQRAFVLHEGGQAEEANRHLKRALRMGKDSGMHFIRFACLLAGAYFSLRKGDEASGLPSLREGLRLGRERGYADTYLWRPGMLESIAAKALEKGIETGYVRDIIRKNALVPDGALPDTGHWPWPVKLYTLGPFELLKDEKPLAFSRKPQHKPLLLLKALVALGGKDVPEEQMTDILWPEADGDLAHQSFATTLKRLRKLLGNEKAVSLREGRVTLDPRYCWVDASAFESLLARIDATARGGERFPDGERGKELAERAVGLYRGPFLAGEASLPWVLEMRERLRSKFLRAVGFLGRRFETEGQWADAVICYQKGLEVDNLAEVLYQRLMICHQRNGKVAEALAAYNLCRTTLSSVLGITPSTDTEAIANRIRSS
jgi:DNA-binding SARP family transcriptional activator